MLGGIHASVLYRKLLREHVAIDAIVRGEGEVTDCIFKLRESIADMAGRIHDLARHVPHTLKGRS